MKKLIAAVLLAVLVFSLPAVAETASSGAASQTIKRRRAPKTSSKFDYDAIMENPDDYIGENYYLSGTISLLYEAELSIPEWTEPTIAVFSIDDDGVKNLAYIEFDNKGGEIVGNDTVGMFVEFLGTIDTKSQLGFTIKMPLFIAYTTEIFEQ